MVVETWNLSFVASPSMYLGYLVARLCILIRYDTIRLYGFKGFVFQSMMSYCTGF